LTTFGGGVGFSFNFGGCWTFSPFAKGVGFWEALTQDTTVIVAMGNIVSENNKNLENKFQVMVKYLSGGGSLEKAVPPTDNKNKGSGENSQN